MSLVFDSVSLLFDYLNEIKDRYYFRGYKKADELKPGLGRCRGYRDNESRMFIDFSKLQDVRDLNIDTLRRLFELGQHYGLPTRFLDWSLDPYVALYFAFGKKCKYDNKPVFIACLDKKNQQLTDIKEILDLKFTLDELDSSPLGEVGNFTLSELGCFDLEMEHPDLSRYTSFHLAWQKYEQYVSRIDGFIFFSYKKDIVNLRKEDQKGVFSFHKSIDYSFPQELYEGIDIHFDLNQKNEATKMLARKGIDALSLFPDDDIYKIIEQKCRQIKEEYQTVA